MITMGDVVTNAGAQPSAWYQDIVQAGTAYLQLEQQRELLKIQNERARQGLPPLDASAYTPGVSVGVAQSTQNTLITALLIMGGVYLAGKILR